MTIFIAIAIFLLALLVVVLVMHEKREHAKYEAVVARTERAYQEQAIRERNMS